MLKTLPKSPCLLFLRVASRINAVLLACRSIEVSRYSLTPAPIGLAGAKSLAVEPENVEECSKEVNVDVVVEDEIE